MGIRAVIAIGLLLAAGGNFALGQDAPDPFERSFYHVIPKPTGKNGYEELVMAGDLATSSKAMASLDQTPPPGPRLAAIRSALAQPELVRARKLLQQGLAKPVRSPRTGIDDETRLPEFAGFRSLARLIGYQMYVDCADGRVARAVDALQEGLRLGYVIQTDSLISGIVGIAADAITLRKFQSHLDQMSAADCERLLGVVREWMRLPDPALVVMNAERRGVEAILRKYRSNPQKLFESLAPDSGSEQNQKSEEELKSDRVRAYFANNPASTGQVFDQAGARMSAHFDRLLAELAKPYWQREALPTIEDESPSGLLCGLLGGNNISTVVMERYAREQAEVQMLGVYAAIRRYRWERNALPATLAELNLGPLAIDPFTGRPFEYKPINDRQFELGSIGPFDRREGAAPGSRQALTMPIRPAR